jgi:hypothetical protein
MLFKLVTLLLLVGTFFQLIAQTSVPGGTIDGDTWTVMGSPYHVTGNLKIRSLTIEAGVEVLFDSDYDFEIEDVLIARGTYQDSIVFKSAPGNTNGWNGLLYKDAGFANELRYCRIEDASATAGVRVEGSTLSLRNCDIMHNENDGLRLKDAYVAAYNCRIIDNGVNGIYADAWRINLLNCIIARNNQQGIFLRSDKDSLFVTNSAIINNGSTGIFSNNGYAMITNSIIYDNETPINYAGTPPTVTYCDVEGGFSGTGNITSPPGFAETEFYSLSNLSLCIDAGDPAEIFNDHYFPPSQGLAHNDMGVHGGPDAGRWYNPLYISPLSIDFGNVRRDSSKSAGVIVKNYSDTVLTVSDITFVGTDADNYVADTTSFFLAVYDSLPITASFTPDRSGLFSAYMRLESDQARDSVSLTGRGVVPNIYVSDDQLDFEDVVLGDSLELTFTVTNTGTDTLKIYEISTVTSFYSIGTIGLAIPPALNQTIDVLFKPDTSRFYQDTITIHSNDPDPGDNPYTIALSGMGKGPLISVDVEHLDFKQVRVSEDSVISFTIANLGNADLTVTALNIEGLDKDYYTINNETFPLIISPAAGNAEISVTYTPIARETNSALLEIAHNDLLADTIKLSLAGQGIAPELTVELDSLYFGKVALDSSKTQPIFIHNTGEVNLVVTEVRLNGSDKEAFAIASDVSKDLVIPVNNSAKIDFTFNPKKANYAWIEVELQSDDPLDSIKYVKLSGIGTVPHIWITSENLDFGRIAKDSDSTRNIYIKNTGDAPLFIWKDSVSIAPEQPKAFYCNLTKDYLIAPGDSSDWIPITFTPPDSFHYQHQLLITSNDKANNPAYIQLSGSGFDPSQPVIQVKPAQTLDFASAIITQEKDSTVIISNIGDKTLVITKIEVLPDNHPEFDFAYPSLPLTLLPHQSDFVSVTFKPKRPYGKRTVHLRIASNDATAAIYDLNIVAQSIKDSSSAEISLDPSSNMLVNGIEDTLKFVITDEEVLIDSAIIYLRKGGEVNFAEQKMLEETDDYWYTIISGEMISERGLEYIVYAGHGGDSTFSPGKDFTTPASLPVSVPYRAFPEMTQKNYYQMISIPFDVQGKSLADLFADNLGDYDNKRYRIFDWKQQSEEYIEMTTMTRSLPAGKSLWLITRGATKLDVANGVSLPTNEPYSIALSKGWNMIGNPFAFPVSWDLVDSSKTLKYWDGQGWLDEEILKPFQGYAVNAKQDTVIKIPAVAIASQQKLATRNIFTGNNWRIKISAVKGVYHDRDNFVGVTAIVNQCTVPEPPTIGDAISLYCVSEGRPQERYSAYYQQKKQDGYQYTLKMCSNFQGKTCITVCPENLPDGFNWVVVSPDLKIKYPMGAIYMEQREHLFQIFVGSEDYLSNNLQDFNEIPRRFDMAQNFPNPFNPVTTIKYQVPKATKVSLVVYDLLGRRVITLARDDLKEPGYYQLQWKGQNQRGDLVASGLYILTLHADSYFKAIKMILQK